MSHDDFYRALEDRFRASREEITHRLAVYQPFLQALAQVHPHPTGFDIGCGRGEWLELLKESGWQAVGVDLDESMLAACHERGLEVRCQDALEALRQYSDESLVLISAFHVVEHLSFDYLRALLNEIVRVLKPGGLLILETPNSENLIVGTNNFYIDPTHQRPVPAVFLEFLCQFSGFTRTKVLRLQEDPALHAPDAVAGVWQVLYGVSPDYSVVAQKLTDSLSDGLQAVFDADYGLDLATLALRHDRYLQHQASQVSDNLRELSRLYQEQSVALEQMRSVVNQTQRALQELDAVYGSRSWRITRPLRTATAWAQTLRATTKRLALVETRRLLKAVLNYACRRFGLSDPLQSVFRRLPAADRYVRQKLAVFDQLIVPQVLDFSPHALEYPARIRQLTHALQVQLIAQERLSQPFSGEALPRLAFVSPLPPERTGIADYSAELLPVLARYYQIDVVVSQSLVVDGWIQSHCPIRNTAWFVSHAKDYDVVLYQVGNSHFHGWMLDLIQQVPGIVVLHDFYLSGLIWALEETSAHQGIKWQALYAEQGHTGLRALAQATDESSVAFHYPFNLLLLEHAQGVIVHSEFSKHLALQWYGAEVARSWVSIPHLRQPLKAEPRHEARARLNLPKQAFVVCSFGLLGMTKLNDRLLSAWLHSKLSQEPFGYLVFVGALGTDEYAHRLRQCIADSGVSERIIITGWADTDTFRQFLSAADIAVQLRTMSRGESSGTVLDCMNYGVPTVVNAHGSMADLPDSSVWRLPDVFTDEELVQALESLWRNPHARLHLGQQARASIERFHAPERCAQQYHQAIEQILRADRAQKDHRGVRLKTLKDPLQVIESGQSTLLALAEDIAHNQRPPLRRPQLLIDITGTHQHDRHTGIERVVRALTLALLAQPPEGMRVEPVYLSDVGDRWHYRYAQAWTARLQGLAPQLPDAGADFSSGDVLLALDISGVTFIEACQAGVLQRLRGYGVRCHMLLHDLLPVTRPEFFPPKAAEMFERWLQQAVLLDEVICVSQTVAQHLTHWLAEHPSSALPRITYSHHGADVAQSAPTRGLPEEANHLLARLAQQPGILMVGTLEPRKGYLQALEAFSLLWSQGVDLCLVIVGREGWTDLPEDQRRDIPELMARLRHHPELGQRLFWLNGISDEFLELLYGACRGLLAASWDEGFGLPLIEAAQKGLPILARDIPVFHEVGGVHLRYFVADTPEPLANAVRHWVEQGFQPSSQKMPWLHWQESAEHLKGLLVCPV